jgi:hypothetical protein
VRPSSVLVANPGLFDAMQQLIAGIDAEIHPILH